MQVDLNTVGHYHIEVERRSPRPQLRRLSGSRIGVAIGTGLGGRYTALRLATLVFASFQGPQGRGKTIDLLLVHAGSLSRPAL